MGTFKIFIVVDYPFFEEMLKFHLQLNPDYKIYLYTTTKECLSGLLLNPDIILGKYIDFNKFKPYEFGEFCFQLILKNDFLRVIR